MRTTGFCLTVGVVLPTTPAIPLRTETSAALGRSMSGTVSSMAPCPCASRLPSPQHNDQMVFQTSDETLGGVRMKEGAPSENGIQFLLMRRPTPPVCRCSHA